MKPGTLSRRAKRESAQTAGSDPSVTLGPRRRNGRIGSWAAGRRNACMLQHCLNKQTLCRRDCGSLECHERTFGFEPRSSRMNRFQTELEQKSPSSTFELDFCAVACPSGNLRRNRPPSHGDCRRLKRNHEPNRAARFMKGAATGILAFTVGGVEVRRP
jgi:hypothetical protein